jgi:hypothetical protein
MILLVVSASLWSMSQLAVVHTCHCSNALVFRPSTNVEVYLAGTSFQQECATGVVERAAATGKAHVLRKR